MSRFQRYLGVAVVAAAIPAVGVFDAAPALADCVATGGGSSVCAQGTVRGTYTDTGSSGPYQPGYDCGGYDWYCNDGWDLDVVVDPGPPNRPNPPNRPIRPGGGGGGRPGGGGRG